MSLQGENNNVFKRPEAISHSPQPVGKESKPSTYSPLSSCKKCENQDNEEMVQCDKCDLWFHFICVGVTADIAGYDWSCDKCSSPSNPKKNTLGGKNTNTSHSSKRSTTSSSRKIQLNLQRLDEERKLQELRDEKEKKLQELRDEKEKRLQELRDQEYLDKKYQLLQEMEQSGGETTDDNSEIEHGKKLHQIRQWVDNNFESGHKASKGPYVLPNLVKINRETRSSIHQVNLVKGDQLDLRPGPSRAEMQFSTNNLPTKDIMCIQQQPVLTTQQIAARHVVPKELPFFGGRPEEWPLFIATYESSTRTCGFSNEENLIRLQRCLKGMALDSVRGRLMQPSTVPDVIQTLRMLYGRPELIIHTLLQKLRKEPSPKAENFETLIQFALSVQNICATMEVSGLTAHLCNPYLLQELTDKLPAYIRLMWAIHKQTTPVVTISTFSSWLYQIATAASDVTLMTISSVSDINAKVEKRSWTNKAYLNTHTEHQDNNMASATNAKQELNSTNKIRKCCICDKHCSSVRHCEKFRNLPLSQKWKAVKQHKLCRTCLNPHGRTQCKVNSLCGKDNCIFRHNQLLHNDTPKSTQKEKSTTMNMNTEIQDQHCNTHQKSNQAVLFRIVPVILSKNGVTVKTYAFLDEGSSLTLVDEQIAEDLRVEGNLEPLCLKWTGNTHRIEENSKNISIEIAGTTCGEKKFNLRNVHTVKNLNLPIQSISMENLSRKYSHLKDVPTESYQQAVPRILIGLDNWKLGLPLKSKEGPNDEPIASKTRLGWTVYGPCKKFEVSGSLLHYEHHSFHICECQRNLDCDLHRMVKDFYSIESIGISKPKKYLSSKEDNRALLIMESTTIRKEHRFETGLLWKYDEVELPNSYGLTRRTKWFQGVKSIEKGDIVIIVDENLPRNCWPKGKVIEVIRSKDGQVRRAIVRTAIGIYERPVVKLAILDIRVAKDDGKSIHSIDIPGGSVIDNSKENY